MNRINELVEKFKVESTDTPAGMDETGRMMFDMVANQLQLTEEEVESLMEMLWLGDMVVDQKLCHPLVFYTAIMQIVMGLEEDLLSDS